MNRDHILGWHERMRPLGPVLRSTPAKVLDTSAEDFERGDHSAATEPAEEELPEGVWEAGPGVYKARCRSCERDYELCYDAQEFTEEANFCFGSERCCP